MRTGAVTTLDDPPLVLAPSERIFRDRHDAGIRLAKLLAQLRSERPVVVGMARGGVPVAAEVAQALDAPLDVAVVRKIGAPNNPEYALGARRDRVATQSRGRARDPRGSCRGA